MIGNLGRLDAKSYQNHDYGDKVRLLTTSLNLNPLVWLSACEDFAECILRCSFKKQLLQWKYKNELRQSLRNCTTNNLIEKLCPYIKASYGNFSSFLVLYSTYINGRSKKSVDLSLCL
jgi:hypothetical protein